MADKLYRTAADLPGVIPPNEVWFDPSVSDSERDRILADMDGPVIYESHAEVRRGGGRTQDDFASRLVQEMRRERIIVQVASPNVKYECPEFPVRQLAETLGEVLAEKQAESVEAIVAPLVEAIGQLIEAVLSHKPAVPKVIVEVPPANPTPVQLHMPAEEKKPPTKRKRKFTKNEQGEIDGVEDVEG